MPFWADLYKLWQAAFRPDPLAEYEGERSIEGAGVSQPDAIPDMRGNDGFWSGGRSTIRLRDSNDFVDLSSVTNRQARYKEYQRLRSVAEIEMALTVFADESCVSGDTKVATPFGYIPIEELAAQKKPGERFMVYCYDFKKQDWTLGWGHTPRQTKIAETVKVITDDGNYFVCTPDHRVLMRSGEWKNAGEIVIGDELMPFYRIRANQHLTKLKHAQFPRVFSFQDGWKHERQFIDEWRAGKKIKKYEQVNKMTRLVVAGLKGSDVAKMVGSYDWTSCTYTLERFGFSYPELKYLAKNYPDRRRVVGVMPHDKIPVYDLSVDGHENFASEGVCFHNCQIGENGHMFEIKTKDMGVKEEAELVLHEVLEMEENLWSDAKNLFLDGDLFYELVTSPDNPKAGIVKIQRLPADSMYRIETVKGKLLEFQQSKEGPDYQSLSRVEVRQATEADLQQATALRFSPEQVIHMKIGDDRKTFYPYGVSMVEAARGPAHQLRLMEDAMVVYRLCLVGDTRVRTPNGWKHIKDIRENDTVICYVPGGVEAPHQAGTKVTAFVNNGVQPVFKVRTQHNEIVGTETHPILVRDENVLVYVDIKDLVPGRHQIINLTRRFGRDVILGNIRYFENPVAKLNASQRKEFRNNKYENISELIRSCDFEYERVRQFLYCKGKCLPLTVAKKIATVFRLDPTGLIVCNKGETNPERIKLPDYMDEGFAQLFGFLLGDGSVTKHTVGFAAGTDEIVNNRYRDLLTRYFTDVRWQRDKRSRRKIGKYIVHSTTAAEVMRKLGFVPGAKNKRIPSWAFTAPINIREALVRGLSDADGCERMTRAGLWFSTIELCNKELVLDIKELWHSIGKCAGQIRFRNRFGGHEIEPGHTMKPTKSWSVTISDRPLPPYESVWSVEPAGEEEVFDISVEHECHNFIANGMPVHNTRAPERRVFYIDIGQLAPFRAEAFIERMKDQFRKRKVHTNKSGGVGASSVDERWHAPSQDEDYWLPLRPNSQTRIETLPGAQNLGEIDDALYFRNKLFIALNFPKNYAGQDDPQQTRITLSSQDVKFARLIERLQKSIARGLKEIVIRHLQLRGFPEERFYDLQIKMTPPSDWREISRNEVVEARYNRAAAIKGAQLMSDYDILVDILKFDADRAKEYVARMKEQKLEDLKLQIMAQNPQLLGLGQPPSDEKEIGVDAKGPSPQLSPDGGQEPPENPPGPAAPGAEGEEVPPGAGEQPAMPSEPLPEVTEEDVEKYNLKIRNYAREIDEESPDLTELGET